MRIMIYGMQSSGASLFCFFLAQHPSRIGIVDLYSLVPAPALPEVTQDVVMKCVVSAKLKFEDQVASFRPDVKILFRRNRMVNASSLRHKAYRDESGNMEKKFSVWETLNPKDFDIVLSYEEFLFDRAECLAKLGSLAEPSFYEFPRTREQIRVFNELHSEWCREKHRYGFGNIHFDAKGRPRPLPRICTEQDSVREYLKDHPGLIDEFMRFAEWYQGHVSDDLVPLFSWMSWERDRTTPIV